jgi:hypothetical protein
MYKIFKMLGVFSISLMLFSTLLSGTGVAAHLGLNTPPDSSDAAQDARRAAGNVSTGAPTGETLFGAYNVLSTQIAGILGVINPSLRMLYNAGVPGYLVGGPTQIGFFSPILALVKGLAVIDFFRGFSG